MKKSKRLVGWQNEDRVLKCAGAGCVFVYVDNHVDVHGIMRGYETLNIFTLNSMEQI